MITFRLTRTSMCNANALTFFNYDTTDLNVIYTLLNQYNEYYCCTRCGCHFEVMEVEPINGWAVIASQPYIDIKDWIAPVNPPYQPSYVYPTPIWLDPNTTATPIDGDYIMWNGSQWTTTAITPPASTLTGDISGPATVNTRIATDNK